MRRSQLAAANYGYWHSHSRFFWGFRLHGLFALDGTPRAISLTSPKRDERDVCLELVDRCARTGPLIVIADKGYTSRDFAAAMLDRQALIVRPRRKDEPGPGPHLAPIRQRIEHLFGPAKTCSVSNAMAPAPCTASEPGSANACSPSPPASRSTTASAAPPARSLTTAPDGMELLI